VKWQPGEYRGRVDDGLKTESKSWKICIEFTQFPPRLPKPGVPDPRVIPQVVQPNRLPSKPCGEESARERESL
jgi:hypothetical protein